MYESLEEAATKPAKNIVNSNFIPSPKQEAALNLLRKSLLPSAFIRQLTYHILAPHLINQGNYETCGAAVFVLLIAQQYPSLYVKMAEKLITEGHCEFPFPIQLHINNKPLTEYTVAELLINSIRNSRNKIFSVQSSNTQLGEISGCTYPSELELWLSQLSDFMTTAEERTAYRVENHSLDSDLGLENRLLNKTPSTSLFAASSSFFGRAISRSPIPSFARHFKAMVENKPERRNARSPREKLSSINQCIEQFDENKHIILNVSPHLIEQCTIIKEGELPIMAVTASIRNEPNVAWRLAESEESFSGKLSSGHYINLEHINRCKIKDENYINIEFSSYGNRYRAAIAEDSFCYFYRGFISASLPPKDIAAEKWQQTINSEPQSEIIRRRLTPS